MVRSFLTIALTAVPPPASTPPFFPPSWRRGPGSPGTSPPLRTTTPSCCAWRPPGWPPCPPFPAVATRGCTGSSTLASCHHLLSFRSSPSSGRPWLRTARPGSRRRTRLLAPPLPGPPQATHPPRPPCISTPLLPLLCQATFPLPLQATLPPFL